MNYPTLYLNPSRAEWPTLTARCTQQDDSITATVRQILDEVRAGGDAALRSITQRIDGAELTSFEVTDAERQAAAQQIPESLKTALAAAKANIEAFHRAQLPQAVDVQTQPGVRCCQRAVPISRVGLYIPGGKAPLFSTVLMLALPAQIAGCAEVILCTPCNRAGEIAPEILYAADLCGVKRIYRVGGAQAIAAMAYGTESIGRVDKIFGPGNRYVTKAKQLVSMSTVAIDMPAGPSEVLVLADESACPDFVAADFLSQAEHGGDSQSILVCASERFAQQTLSALARQTALLGRSAIISEALSHSRILVFDTLAEQVAFANAYAPEHLILAIRDAWSVADRITAAGSVFVGDYSPESAGDYASGTNHTLPTSGWARSYSGVNLDSYFRKITFQELTPEGLASLAPTIIRMAEAEGLDAHAAAVKIRLEKGAVR